MNAAALFAVALTLSSPYSKDRSRIATIALAVTTQSQRAVSAGIWPARMISTLQGLALATAYQESGRFDPDVHTGDRRGDHGHSICLMQIHSANHVVPSDQRESLVGTDLASTERCIWAGIRTLARARHTCIARRYFKNWLPATITLYATGNRCWIWRGAKSRAALATRIAYSKLEPTEEMRSLIDDLRERP